MSQASLKNIASLLQQADALRFKLLGIVGKDQIATTFNRNHPIQTTEYLWKNGLKSNR
jgi:hypothetical protein